MSTKCLLCGRDLDVIEQLDMSPTHDYILCEDCYRASQKDKDEWKEVHRYNE